MDTHGLYLYCIVPAGGTPPVIAAPALDGGQVGAVCHEGVAALTHACPPRPYQGSEDLVRDWVAAHNAVVEEAWGSAGSVLPMSFDVIVRGDDSTSAEAQLRCWLREHHEALRGRLAALQGRAEVGVQVMSRSPAPGEGAAAGLPPARGRAYFARQQLSRQLADQREREASARADRYLENLAALSEDIHANAPRHTKDMHMVLNASLLVLREMIPPVGEYLEVVRREPATEVRFTGPWPPYSFVGTFDTVVSDQGAGKRGEPDSGGMKC